MACRRLVPLLLAARPIHGQDGRAPDGTEVELEFEPLGQAGPGPEELMAMLSGSQEGGPARPRRAGQRPELGSLFEGLLAAPPAGARQRRSMRQLPGGGIMMGDIMEMPGSWMEPSFSLRGPSNLPASMFHELFPEVNEASSFDGEEAAAPDLMVSDMMGHFSRVFQDQMMPAIHRSASAGLWPCRADAEARCNGTKSQLHCLGRHADEISEPCRKHVGKSVPFLCHDPIARWCDGLDRGILPCLADKLAELSGSCRDAVITTHRVIAKVNMQKSSMRLPETGERLVHVPPSPASAAPTAAAVAAKTSTSAAPAQRRASADDAKREVRLDSSFRAPPSVPRPVKAAPASTSKAPVAPPAAANAAGVKPEAAKQALAEPARASRSVGSMLQGVVLVALLGACAYLLKYRVQGPKALSKAKGGALLELNTGACGDHTL